MYTIFFIIIQKKKKDAIDESKVARELIYNVLFCNFYERSSNVCKQEKKKALTSLMDKFIIHC